MLGIFVGGKSKRFGGRAKGRVVPPGSGECIVELLARAGRELDLPVCLVGDATPYGGIEVDLPRLDDVPAEVGPLGGLGALLQACKNGNAIAVGCDMPFLTTKLLGALWKHPSKAPIVAAYQHDRWEPFFARYDAARLQVELAQAIENGAHSFQSFFSQTETEVFETGPDLHEALIDWDAPPDTTWRWK